MKNDVGFPDIPGRVIYLSGYLVPGPICSAPGKGQEEQYVFFSGYTRKETMFCPRKDQKDKCDLSQKARKSIETPKGQEDQCALGQNKQCVLYWKGQEESCDLSRKGHEEH